MASKVFVTSKGPLSPTFADYIHIKGELSLNPYEMPGELEKAIRVFIEHYNYQRYHEGLGDVTPYDVYTGRHLEIIQKRKEAKSRTLAERKNYNRIA
ncbi:MAG: hypothetical protein QGI95_00210, partial [Dehalococcoidales bacterium]|nr:hypothetical protein [Dehalococcoidales bacterium]